jgi:hypothetical protein
LLASSDGNNAVAQNGNRIGFGSRRIDRPDVRILDDEVGGGPGLPTQTNPASEKPSDREETFFHAFLAENDRRSGTACRISDLWRRSGGQRRASP